MSLCEARWEQWSGSGAWRRGRGRAGALGCGDQEGCRGSQVKLELKISSSAPPPDSTARNPTRAPPPSEHRRVSAPLFTTHHTSKIDTARPRLRAMRRGADAAAHLDAALNLVLLGEWVSKLDTLPASGGGRRGGSWSAGASRLVAPPPADVAIARRVIARWRALVLERKGCPLLDLLQRQPDFFAKEVLERLDRVDRTMLAQVGRPWLAAVLASGLPRLLKGVTVLQLREFCTSVERLAWAKAKGCPWAWSLSTRGWREGSANPCALAAEGGHLAVLQWARAHHCPWDAATCYAAASGGHLDVLQWARKHGCPWNKQACYLAARTEVKAEAWCLLIHAGASLAQLTARKNIIPGTVACRWVRTMTWVYQQLE